MSRLAGPTFTYDAHDTTTQAGRTHSRASTKLLDDIVALPCLKLRVGAQVMLVKNIDEDLVNGSLGIVQSFLSESTFERDLELMDDADSYPLESAGGFSPQFLCRPHRGTAADSRVWPVVRFTLASGLSRLVLCTPEEWKVESAEGTSLVARRQVPLTLAWALSIHKAQGQTLTRARVDLRRAFENGQAYVALSRARDMDGLQVLNFHPSRISAHPRVRQFYGYLPPSPPPPQPRVEPMLASDEDTFSISESFDRFLEEEWPILAAAEGV
jgi:ATP-dependent DNA helicase PIF1